MLPLPIHVAALGPEERARRVVSGSDTCVLDGAHFFVLGNLDVPIVGGDRFLRWTSWTTLSGANFARATQLWTSPGRESEPAYFGWFSNRIPGYPETVNLKCHVHTQPVGVRPLITVLDEHHPLGADQRDGISAARAQELAHACMAESDGAAP